MAFFGLFGKKEQQSRELTDAERIQVLESARKEDAESINKLSGLVSLYGFAAIVAILVAAGATFTDLDENFLEWLKNKGDSDGLSDAVREQLEQYNGGEGDSVEDLDEGGEEILNENEADVQDEVLAEDVGSGNETVVEEEDASADPEISPEIAQMMNELGIPDHLADHIVEIDGHTYILENPSDPTSKIAEIKELSDVDGGAWARNNISGFDDRSYILATIGDNKPFATVNMLKEIGYDPTGRGDAIAYTNHVSDNYDTQGNRRADCWQNNQIQTLEYGNWSCGTSVADPVCIPEAELQHVQVDPEVVEPVINLAECDVYPTDINYETGEIKEFFVTDSHGDPISITEYDEPAELRELAAHTDGVEYRNGKLYLTNDELEVARERSGYNDAQGRVHSESVRAEHPTREVAHPHSGDNPVAARTIYDEHGRPIHRELYDQHGHLVGHDRHFGGAPRPENYDHYDHRSHGDHRHGSRGHGRTQYEINPYQRGQHYSGYDHSYQPTRFHPGYNFPQPHGRSLNIGIGPNDFHVNGSDAHGRYYGIGLERR